jgi:hypothetical protein
MAAMLAGLAGAAMRAGWGDAMPAGGAIEAVTGPSWCQAAWRAVT